VAALDALGFVWLLECHLCCRISVADSGSPAGPLLKGAGSQRLVDIDPSSSEPLLSSEAIWGYSEP
jgi:hypothetical protein